MKGVGELASKMQNGLIKYDQLDENHLTQFTKVQVDLIPTYLLSKKNKTKFRLRDT